MLRRLTTSALLCAALLTGCGAASGPPAGADESARIQALIQTVEDGHGVRAFIRNGVKYTPEEGAEHLRTKLGQAGLQVRTLDDFITRIASTSSLSGQPYLVELDDGRTIEARAWYAERGFGS